MTSLKNPGLPLCSAEVDCVRGGTVNRLTRQVTAFMQQSTLVEHEQDFAQS